MGLVAVVEWDWKGNGVDALVAIAEAAADCANRGFTAHLYAYDTGGDALGVAVSTDALTSTADVLAAVRGFTAQGRGAGIRSDAIEGEDPDSGPGSGVTVAWTHVRLPPALFRWFAGLAEEDAELLGDEPGACVFVDFTD